MLKIGQAMELDGQEAFLEFEVIRTQAERAYGICARLWQDDSLVDTATARERFFTQEEAEAALRMLKRYQVTPCTLCDVL